VDTAAHIAAIDRLEPFLGLWTLETSLPAPEGVEVTSRVEFERALDGTFLVQHSQISIPEAPDGLSVIGFEPKTGGYVQHYFDSRGVARLYAMQFDGGLWTLTRDAEDFTPLDFAQRYTGRFSDDGRSIEGGWEISHDKGTTWEIDFELNYRRSG
jgi:hypothetical protein